MASFESELAAYQKDIDRLRIHTGKFVLIKGDRVGDIFDTYADALKAGYERYKLDPFLVKKIETIERAMQFTRSLQPVCP